jgi:type I restriction enzyme S subunit
MKQYDSYKDSGVEWIGKIPSHWEVIPLKRKMQIIRGGSPRPIEQYLSEEGYNWIKIGDTIKGDKYIRNTSQKIKPEGLSATRLVHRGDLILSNSMSFGEPYIIDIEEGCIHDGWLSLSHLNNVDKEFLYYTLLSELCKKQFESFVDGGVVKNLNIDKAGYAIVFIPPISEQLLIVSYLDKKCGEIDKAIATQEKRVELLKELRQNIITQAVTRGINPNAPLKDSGVEWIGKVPEHWEVNRLKTLCRTIRNGYVGPTRDLYVDDGIPYIQSVHIKDGEILFEREEYYVTKDWADKHPKIYKGDIIVVQTGDIGQIALVTNKFDKCNCHALIILSINNNVISSEYLSLYLRSHIGKELMLQTKTGALLPHLNSTQIGDTTTIVPPLSEQQEIVSYIESQTARLDKSIGKAEHQIELLQELKQSIITEVVTGKRKVC